MAFQIDPRFFDACRLLGTLPQAHVLLMDNAELPWLLLIPNTDEVELHRLEENSYRQIFQQTRILATFLTEEFSIDKINTACNGNLVRQMHLHVIGRRFDDYCWPDVAIGKPVRRRYGNDAITEIAEKLALNQLLREHGYIATPN